MDLLKDGKYEAATAFVRGKLTVEKGRITEADHVWKKYKGYVMDIFWSIQFKHGLKLRYLGR